MRKNNIYNVVQKALLDYKFTKHDLNNCCKPFLYSETQDQNLNLTNLSLFVAVSLAYLQWSNTIINFQNLSSC